MTDSVLPANIYRRAVAWSGQITQLAKSFAPAHLRDAISSRVEPHSENSPTYTITVTVNRNLHKLPREGTLDARAQEFGSKMFAPISIEPKYAQHLVFMGTNDFVGKKILSNHVNHPGINAANGGMGYIHPAITVIRERGLEELSVDVRQAVLSDIRAAFSKDQIIGVQV